MEPFGVQLLLSAYNLLWAAALPIIRRHSRVGTAFAQRTLGQGSLPVVDLWVQAASAGEAYLAGLLAANLRFPEPLRVLFTTNTRQGHEILEKSLSESLSVDPPQIIPFIRYLPFDQPRIMARAVAQARPRLAVLMETELWPAMLYHLKRSGCPVLLINGRLTAKSSRHYLAFSRNWTCLAPDRIEAISPQDARRFRRIFPEATIRVMPNMKFDRIPLSNGKVPARDPLARILPEAAPLVVFGSIREPEEAQVIEMLGKILTVRPDVRIALFPRHMHRLDAWVRRLSAQGLAWVRRSQLAAPSDPGTVMLWDTFGELTAVYRRARAVFVGGSLAPLGGQNFLEPLIHGMAPVIGPHWDNFRWVGPELFLQGLVRQAAHGPAAADLLLRDLESSLPRDRVTEAALAFVYRHRGGTDRACRLIEEYLHADPTR